MKKTSLVIGIALASTLGATPVIADTQSPSASASGTPTAVETDLTYDTAVMPDQLQRILENISKAAAAGDKAKDVNQLNNRFVGPALDMRKGNYEVRSNLDSYRASASIGSASVMAQVMGKADESFPRKMIIVSKADDQLVPQALLLKQDSARDNYKVNMTAQLLPGATFPQPLDLNYAADMLGADAQGFTSTPQDALTHYGDVLKNSGEGDFKDKFSDNQYTQQIKDFQDKTTQNIQAANGSVTYSHDVQPDQTVVMKTSKGSALVFGYYVETITLTPETTDAGSGTISLPDEWKGLAGTDTTSGPVTVKYGETVLLNIPQQGSSDKISVVGADQDILSVTLG
ncbi:MAG: hypothetical protein QM632_00285 [Micrococcaceae bacterium]